MKQKMKLNRIKLINWMYFSNETISLGNGSVLITGKNASGKSTILDAVQMVLTGNTTKFNEAANEKSKRDLKGYVRCKTSTETETYLRKGTVISHIALEFFEEEFNRYFTVGVILISQDEVSQVIPKFYIEECSFDSLNFIENNLPVRPDLFKNAEKKIYFLSTKKDYKNKLLRRMNIFDEKFFDVLRKTIAFKPVEDVKVFINKYVLPEKEIDVVTLREKIEKLSELENDLKRAKEECDALEKIVKINQKIQEFLTEENIITLLILIANFEVLKNEQQKIENDSAKNTELKNIAEKNYFNLELQRQKEQNLLIEFQTARKNSNLSASIEKLEQRLIELKNSIKTQNNLHDELTLQIKNLENFFKTVNKYGTKIPEDFEKYKSILEIIPTEQKIELINKINLFIETFISSTQENLFSTKQDKKHNEEEISKTKEKIKNLENKNISYPRETEKLRQEIEKDFSSRGIDSKVYILCELLEITEKDWTNAIEGYLNTQRFYLIVEPKYYNFALEVYKRTKVFGQGLINTRKIPTDCSVQENSLAQRITCKTSDAQHYINYLLGNVICVDDIFDLENYSVAITKECMVYKNYVARKINPEVYETPFIGKDAIEKQLSACKKLLRQLIANYTELETKIERYSEIINTEKNLDINTILKNCECPKIIYDLTLDLKKVNNDLSELKSNPDIIELERKITTQENVLKSIDEKISLENKTIAKCEFAIENLSREKIQKQQQLEESNVLLNSKSTEMTTEYLKAKEKFTTECKTKTPEEITTNFAPRKQSLYNSKINKEKELITEQEKYNSTFTRDFGSGTEKITAFDKRFKTLSEIEILENEEKIKVAKLNAERIFREDFIAKMKESIENARTEFDSLQKALKKHTYGEDSYKFIIEPNSKKRQIYNMICDPENQGNDSLFSSGFESKYKEEIEELFDKIQTKDTSEALLEEYTDYRNYLDYDIEILKKDDRKQLLSKTIHLNSGGESQVPFYVIMAASLNTIYKNQNSIKLIMMDEAFDKMDGQRISSMMDLFNSLDFQTIVFAPDQKIQDLEGKVTTVLTVLRKNTTSSVEKFNYYE